MARVRRLPILEMVCTGNELLDGSILDTNTKTLALALAPLGLKMSRNTVVPDEAGPIAQAVLEAAQRSDFVIVSGGLGPTSDDLTVETVADALGLSMIFSSEAKRNIVRRLKLLRRKIDLNPGQMKQSLIPKGSRVLENAEGTAPGVELCVGKARIFFLPGVPKEFVYILNTHLLPVFQNLRAESGAYLWILKTFGAPESELNELMKKISVPSHIKIGYRVHLPENHIKIQIRSKNPKRAQAEAEHLALQIQKRLGSHTFSWMQHSFEEEILGRLLAQNLVVATAESCTGGLISSMMTQVSGSSKVFDRGFVTYSNEAKMEMLGVKEATLKKFGAVSEEVATEMAEGALKHSRAERSVAVTGVAGPTGGTKAKPVGTVWLATSTLHSSLQKTTTKLLSLGFSRELNQKYSAYVALRMLVDGKET